MISSLRVMSSTSPVTDQIGFSMRLALPIPVLPSPPVLVRGERKLRENGTMHKKSHIKKQNILSREGLRKSRENRVDYNRRKGA